MRFDIDMIVAHFAIQGYELQIIYHHMKNDKRIMY
jgi:hypothetical protein